MYQFIYRKRSIIGVYSAHCWNIKSGWILVHQRNKQREEAKHREKKKDENQRCRDKKEHVAGNKKAWARAVVS